MGREEENIAEKNIAKKPKYTLQHTGETRSTELSLRAAWQWVFPIAPWIPQAGLSVVGGNDKAKDTKGDWQGVGPCDAWMAAGTGSEARAPLSQWHNSLG